MMKQTYVTDITHYLDETGMLDHYNRHKNIRFCTYRDAVAILNSMLTASQREPEFLTPPEAVQLLGVNPGKRITPGKLPAVNTPTRVRPRWKIKRTDVEDLRRTAAPTTRRVTRHPDPDAEEWF